MEANGTLAEMPDRCEARGTLASHANRALLNATRANASQAKMDAASEPTIQAACEKCDKKACPARTAADIGEVPTCCPCYYTKCKGGWCAGESDLSGGLMCSSSTKHA